MIVRGSAAHITVYIDGAFRLILLGTRLEVDDDIPDPGYLVHDAFFCLVPQPVGLSRSPSENPPFALLSASISSLSTWVMNAICIPFGETERHSFCPNTAHLTISCCQQPDQGLLATFRNSDPQRAAPKLLQGR